MGLHARSVARAEALALIVVALTVAGCGSGGPRKKITVIVRTETVTTTRSVPPSSTAQLPACTGGQLTGRFVEVSGSAGAGRLEYLLTLKNTSGSGCWLAAAPPNAKLLDADGSPLPTRIVSAQDVTQSTPPATLEPGGSATAAVRFSPDVPGAGDSQNGPCQPQAYTLEVSATGGGTVDASIRPPTSVCERGTLDFDLLKN